MIIHIKKRENPFVQIDKRGLEDKRLSYKARGILAYLLSKPPSWKVMVKDLVNRSDKDGETAVRSAIKELIEVGYIVRRQPKEENGQFGNVEYDVYEVPLSGFPQAGNPQAGNPPHSDIDSSDNDSSDNDHDDQAEHGGEKVNTNAPVPAVVSSIEQGGGGETRKSRQTIAGGGQSTAAAPQKEGNVKDINKNLLVPDTPYSRMAFARLKANAEAIKRRGPKHFKTLEQKRMFDEAAARLGEAEFKNALETAFKRGLNDITRITNWIAKWKKGANSGTYQRASSGGKRAARDDPSYRVATDKEAAIILAQIRADA